jgi:hypothetical protein
MKPVDGVAPADGGLAEVLTRPHRSVTAAISLLVLFGAGMLAAACGGSTTPGVAGLGSSTSSTVPGGLKGNSGAPPTAQQLAAMTKFAECVRAHGETKFPDPPYSNGELNSLGFRKGSPQMDKATSECHADALAAGVVESQQEIQQHLQQLLEIAKCMQAHGVSNFPDPTATGGFTLSPSVVNAPGYAAAAKVCGGPPGFSAAPGGAGPPHPSAG